MDQRAVLVLQHYIQLGHPEIAETLGDANRAEGLLLAAGPVWAQDMANNQLLRLPLTAFGP